MISPGLVELLFSAASMTRWNDHARPAQFTELAKQAHKMTIAWAVARCEEDGGRTVDWVSLVEGGIFEFFQRIVLTDIKPPVFHRMMENHGAKLNGWVLEKTAEMLEPVAGGFYGRFRRYLEEPAFSAREKRILKASHYLATLWEFRLIYAQNSMLWGIEDTRREIEGQVEEHLDLSGVREIMMRRDMPEKGLYAFIDLCGQLRFQVRWAQLPRVPATSVLGHLLVVAALAYFSALEDGACSARLRNDFFGGLFHDLPEVLTRDIVSPVKRSVGGLEDLIKEYEREAMETRLLPLIPEKWRGEIRHLTEDEFSNRARDPLSGKTITGIEQADMNRYCGGGQDPVDGLFIDACDKLAAMAEAALSIRFGIRPAALEEGRSGIFQRYRRTVIGSVDFGALFGAFMDQPRLP
jgi:putative hydrolase of HD superfamily